MNISVNGHTITRAKHARRWHQRLVGLLATREESFNGLVIDPCNSIHTIGMRYPIDVIFVSSDNIAVKTFSDVRPFKLCFGGKTARYTIELPRGSIEQYGIRSGSRFQLND